MPPLRNAPTGTSLTRCRRSASSMRASSSSHSCSSRARELRLLLQAPVALDARRAAGFEHQRVARRQLVDAFEHRQRRIDQPQREVLVERSKIHPRRPAVEREQRLDLGCAGEAALVAQVVQRLLSEVIARCQQAATLHVPQHEREHAAQAIEQPIAMALVQRDDDLAVAVRQESVAVLLELAAQLAVVVDLAVADQQDRAVGVVQRLLAAGKVDDRQPAMSQAWPGRRDRSLRRRDRDAQAHRACAALRRRAPGRY